MSRIRASYVSVYSSFGSGPDTCDTAAESDPDELWIVSDRDHYLVLVRGNCRAAFQLALYHCNRCTVFFKRVTSTTITPSYLEHHNTLSIPTYSIMSLQDGTSTVTLKDQIAQFAQWLENARNRERNNLTANWEGLVEDFTNLVVCNTNCRNDSILIDQYRRFEQVKNSSRMRIYVVNSDWKLYQCVRINDWHHLPWAAPYRKILHKALGPLREELRGLEESLPNKVPWGRGYEQHVYEASFGPAIDKLRRNHECVSKPNVDIFVFSIP